MDRVREYVTKETENNMSRKVYFIMETERTEAGEFIPCIAVEGEKGFYRTDWAWGKNFDKAQEIADEKNLNLGIDPKEAILIQLSTMGE